MGKMMENDPIVDSLIDRNPFKNRKPPKFVRAKHYKVRLLGISNIHPLLFSFFFSILSLRLVGQLAAKESGGPGS